MTRRSDPSAATAHRDTFARDHLPPPGLWPVIEFTLPELAYPPRLNCAVELLDRTAAAGPDRTAIVHPEGRWSYAELLAHANRIARVLVEDAGLVPGNRVLLRAPNNPMLVACWFAVLKAGGIVVCTMPLLRPREIAYVLDRAQVGLALTDARVSDDLREAANVAAAAPRVLEFGSPDAPAELETLMRYKPDTFDAVDTAAEDIAIIAFTSGTTGHAKGTMHNHRDLLAVADTFSRHVLRPEPDDLFCGSPPLAFTFGLGGLVLFPMRIGASTLLLEQASPPLLLEGVRSFGATISFTAPTAYRAMTAEAAKGGVGRLRKCVSAGETLPAATFEAWERATGIRIIDGIGSTEMLHIFISAADADIRPGSTGRTVPGFRACILDEAGREAPRGTIGRLAVRGPTGCRYLDDPERQRGYVHDGWNLTGDAYVQDQDGYFWYQARTDDMIISGGYNIAGPEVENVLLEHDYVKECGVIGVPDLERGSVVTAVVVLRAGVAADEETVRALQDHVKAQLAPYKYPRVIRFAESLPRTATGKLQRHLLREASA
ncbi:MAG TPA: AMP-binding protein [Longimicrobiales bacterium]|nr:AMP-binding protein [Longimicrobiales bacterium]